MSGFCGLDFGTSNSAVSAMIDNQIQLVPLADVTPDQENTVVRTSQSGIIPSAIFFNSEERTTVFGTQAIEEYVDGYLGRLMRSLKSVLGSALMGDSTQVGSCSIDYAEVIRLFVSHLKQSAEQSLGRSLNQVVVGRPVYFVDHNPEADQRAQNELEAIVRSTGFDDVLFEFEPIAASLDYETSLTQESLVLTMDIGGGTSDFSLMRLGPNRTADQDPRQDILAHSGVHIGGTDFDRLLSLRQVLPEFGLGSQLDSGLDMPVMRFHELATWHEIDNLYTQDVMNSIASLRQRAKSPALLDRFYRLLKLRRGHYLAQLVENAKVDLSKSTSTAIDLSFVEPALELQLSEQDLVESTADAIERIMQGAKKTLDMASLSVKDVDQIVLTGGSTAMPAFEALVAAYFPGTSIVKGNRFSGIAQGLGLVAQQRFR